MLAGESGEEAGGDGSGDEGGNGDGGAEAVLGDGGGLAVVGTVCVGGGDDGGG